VLPTQVERLRDAINSHDADRVAERFTENYQCDMPIQPSRGFTGRARVRENYRAMFARIPDLRATVLRSCQDESGVWSEWEMSGTSDERPERDDRRRDHPFGGSRAHRAHPVLSRRCLLTRQTGTDFACA